MDNIIGFGLFFTAIIILGICGFFSEKYGWNKGLCKICKTQWKHFDTDSQGGRGYICGCPERHSVWISWPVDGK